MRTESEDQSRDSYTAQINLQTISKAITEVRLFYKRGTPLYTKASIRKLYEQLRSYNDQKESVLVQGINGIEYEIPLAREGLSSFPEGEDKKWIM
jgi:hypothetical protein